MAIQNLADFRKAVEEIEKSKDYQQPLAYGIGIATVDSQGNLLDTYYELPNYQANLASAAIFAKVLGHQNGNQFYTIDGAKLTEVLSYFTPFENDGNQHPNRDVTKRLQKLLPTLPANRKLVVTFIPPAESDAGPVSVPDAYLRLHLLSHRLIKPHGINLTGIFKVLPNVAWTSEGAISLADLTNRKMEALAAGRTLIAHSVDKFPRMTDFVVPSGVRIADAARVRLGAYLGEGTTIMHEGFVNFNAGCEGPNMIEGRISAGVFVKKGSDLGGGCSTMGTLSGGNNIVISVGEDCLLGANSGLGIPLGNRCTVEAGLYLTAGTKVLMAGKVIKAKDLSGKDDLLFRRNSQNGQVEAISKTNLVELNQELHAN